MNSFNDKMITFLYVIHTHTFMSNLIKPSLYDIQRKEKCLLFVQVIYAVEYYLVVYNLSLAKHRCLVSPITRPGKFCFLQSPDSKYYCY